MSQSRGELSNDIKRTAQTYLTLLSCKVCQSLRHCQRRRAKWCCHCSSWRIQVQGFPACRGLHSAALISQETRILQRRKRQKSRVPAPLPRSENTAYKGSKRWTHCSEQIRVNHEKWKAKAGCWDWAKVGLSRSDCEHWEHACFTHLYTAGIRKALIRAPQEMHLPKSAPSSLRWFPTGQRRTGAKIHQARRICWPMQSGGLGEQAQIMLAIGDGNGSSNTSGKLVAACPHTKRHVVHVQRCSTHRKVT